MSDFVPLPPQSCADWAISTTFLTGGQRSQGNYFLQCENRKAGKNKRPI